MMAILIFLVALVVVGLIIQSLGKSADNTRAQGLGKSMTSIGKTGISCFIWVIIIAVILVIVLFASH